MQSPISLQETHLGQHQGAAQGRRLEEESMDASVQAADAELLGAREKCQAAVAQLRCRNEMVAAKGQQLQQQLADRAATQDSISRGIAEGTERFQELLSTEEQLQREVLALRRQHLSEPRPQPQACHFFTQCLKCP
eukprot:Skav208476  [mRNA]  locus=scaffold1104:350329:359566:- [translate_table: standard]